MNAPAPETRATSIRYLPGLDGLRGISVLAVLVFHHYLIGGHEPGWMPGGFLGVEVFFVVSGYLITSLLLTERRETGRISLRRFWLRRARRLLPALFTLLAVVVAAALLFLPDTIGTLRSDAIAALTYTSNWWQIAAHRSYFVDAGRPPLLKHLWSLAIEEQFYLFWPPLLILGLRRLGRRRMLGTMLGIAALSSALMAVIASSSIDGAYYATYSRLTGLLLGAAMAFGFAPYRLRGLPGRGVRLAVDLGGALGLIVLIEAFHHYTYPDSTTADLSVFRGGFVVVDLATLLVILAAVHPASDVGRLLGWEPLRWVGLRSYSLYLWHYPIFCITRPSLDFRDFGHLHGWPVFALRIGLSLAAADASYRLVERPIRNGALAQFRARLRATQGRSRRRLARRGALVFGSLAAIAIVLGAGLANAQPQVTKIPGIDTSAQQNDNGAKPDQSVISRLLHSTTTTLPTGTTVPVQGTTTTTTPVTLAPRVLAIGDSVMKGSQRALEATIPGIAVDAVVSRQFWQAPSTLSVYSALHLLPTTIVVHLGTNGHVTDTMFDQMMQTIGPGHQVYFLTARVPRLWESEVNATLHAGAARWHSAHVLEWRDFAGCHDDWFVSDGFHLTTAGQHAYAAFVRDGIAGHPDTTCVK